MCAANQDLLAAREACSRHTATDDVLCKLQSTLHAVEADCEQVCCTAPSIVTPAAVAFKYVLHTHCIHSS